jgi:hypothetical protein
VPLRSAQQSTLCRTADAAALALEPRQRVVAARSERTSPPINAERDPAPCMRASASRAVLHAACARSTASTGDTSEQHQPRSS